MLKHVETPWMKTAFRIVKGALGTRYIMSMGGVEGVNASEVLKGKINNREWIAQERFDTVMQLLLQAPKSWLWNSMDR